MPETNKQSLLTEKVPHKVTELRDLGLGEVFTRDTSYLGEQNEVRDMINATKDSRHWPGYWYEILQGAWDFNDWSKGCPSIEIYYDHVAEPTSLAKHLASRNKKKIARVVVANNIRGDSGLRPGNVVLTQHEEKDDNATLGAHGRGLKIATTATYAGQLAEKITFSSYVPEVGSWYAEAGLVKDPVDSKSPAYFQLKYKRDQTMQAERTEISVHNPGKELCEALEELPNWFLPTNPKYRFYRLSDTEVQKVPNHATVFASSKNVTDQIDSHFNRDELSWWGHRNLDAAKSLEPARVEVLPAELIRADQGPIDYVYVDGLRVKVSGAKFSQLYAFWGWGKGTSDGYNPRRSNDSLRMENSARDLLGHTFARCMSPEVFMRLFHSLSSKDKVYESYCYSSDLDNIEKNAGAVQALQTAWKSFCQELSLDPSTYITSSTESRDRAIKEGKPTVFFDSHAWVSVLQENVPGLESVDKVFEMEDEARRLEAERLHKELLQQRITAEAEKQAAIEAERVKWLEERGILKEAEATGEVIKVAEPENVEDSLEMARLHLIFALSQNEGHIVADSDPSKLILEMKADDFSRLPQNTNQLGPLGDFIQNYLAIYGDKTDLEIRVIKNGTGVYFKFARSGRADNYGNLTIQVQAGSVTDKSTSLVRIVCSPNTRRSEAPQTVITAEQSYIDYQNSIKVAVTGLLGENGVVDPDKYLSSEYYRNYPPAEAFIRTRRQMREAKLQAAKELEVINALRLRANLPPLPNPFEDRIDNPILDGELRGVNQSESTEDKKKGKKESNGRQERRFESTSILDDVPIDEMVLSLIHPDSIPGLSTRGKDQRLQMVMDESGVGERLRQSLREKLQEALKRQITPDFTLVSGEWSKIRGYLISHINPAFSSISTQDYNVMAGLLFEERNSQARLRFNKPINPGLNTLMCPPGYKPVAFYHEKGAIDLTFSGLREKGVFAFTSHQEIKKGLTIYFEKDERIDSTSPDDKERGVIADKEGLAPHWRNLIDALNESPMTDKQKHDVLIRAWTRAFNYDSTQETFDLYAETRTMPIAFATNVINEATGNCGYAERGFHGLTSLIGIPSREIASFLSDGFGNFTVRGNYHAIQQSYLGDRWVYVEPQAGYIEPGYEMEDIPIEQRDQFMELLEAIPRRESVNAQMIDGLPPILADELPPIADIKDELIQTIIDSIPFNIPRFTNPVAILQDLASRFDLYEGKGFVRKLGFTLAGGGVAAILLAKVLPVAVAQAATIIPTLTSTPTTVPTITPDTVEKAGRVVEHISRLTENSPILLDALHKVPLEIIVPAVLVGLISFRLGRAYEKLKSPKVETEDDVYME